MSEQIGGTSGLRRASYASIVSGRLQRQRQFQQQTLSSSTTSTSTTPPPPSGEVQSHPSHDINPTTPTFPPIMDSSIGWDHHHQEQQPPPFFTPTYLRSSRHLSRLRASHERTALEFRELTRTSHLPTNISSTTTSKLPPSHPLLLSDVIERLPPPADESLHPLPSRFSPADKCPGLETLAQGSEVRFNGITKTTDEAASVRADFPMPREVGIFYFEVTILSRSKDCLIGVGFSSKKASLNRLPGWESESWAYHGDDGFVFACTASGKAYGPKFGGQDVVGCGIHFGRGEAFFTRNGVFLGTAFKGVKGEKLFPSIGMKKPGEHVRVNFGAKPFVFDIDGMVERERDGILGDIGKADVKDLHPPDDEDSLVRNLVGQYLAHEGYVETARAFNQEWNEREDAIRPAGEGRGRRAVEMEEEDVHAVNRQKIRKSILEGDIDRAMKLQHSYYPRLFDDERNRGVWFRLRCRKFVEMMRKAGEGIAEGKMAVNPSTEEEEDDDQGEEEDEDEGNGDQGDTQMDLDNQLHPSSQQEQHQNQQQPPDRDNDQAMHDTSLSTSQESLSASRKTAHMHATTLESQALSYGRELQSEFGADPNPTTQKILNDCFGVLAYSSWKESPMRGMFEKEGRGPVAEEVNGVILRGLGKSSVAALERLAAQTEALLDEGAGKGGGRGALVCVEGDFLRG